MVINFDTVSNCAVFFSDLFSGKHVQIGNSHLYTYITPNISWGVVFPFWRSSPVMGNPPIHWKPKMNIALMMRSFAKTIIDKHINVYHCYISATIFVFPILPIIYDYIGIIWSQFLSYCTFSLKKKIKDLYLIWTFVNFESYSAPFNFSYFSDGRWINSAAAINQRPWSKMLWKEWTFDFRSFWHLETLLYADIVLKNSHCQI